MDHPWRDNQIFFLHIHKTAGTSFINLLDQCYTINEVCPSNWPYRQRLHEVDRDELLNAKFIRGHFSYDRVVHQLSSKPYILIFLRDPVTRFISHFEHLKREEGDPPGLHDKIKNLSIDEYLQKPELTSLLSNMGARLLCGLEPDQPYDISFLNKAKERLASIDFIGLTERYKESISLFCKIFNLPDVKYFHHENPSPNTSARIIIAPQTIERISYINQIDVDLYNYGKKLFEEQFADRRKVEPSSQAGLRSHFELDFRYIDPGQGWYIGENHPIHGIARWSGPELTSFIRVPALLEKEYTLKINIINSVDHQQLDEFSVDLNGIDIPLLKIVNDVAGTVTFEGHIPHSSLRQLEDENILGFRVQKTIRPCDIDPNNPDIRKLGLCYNSLSIFPAE